MEGLDNSVHSDKVITIPIDREKIRKRKEEMQARLAAMTPEQRKALAEKVAAHRAELKEKMKDNPKRIVRRIIDEDGTRTFILADGTKETYKFVEINA